MRYDAYFQAKVNKTYEVYKFRNATQEAGKSLDSYHSRLRRLAHTCEFVSEEEEIKSHIILYCSSSRLRRRALLENMDLNAILDYARGLEMSEKQTKRIEEQEKVCRIKTKDTQSARASRNTQQTSEKKQ